MNVINRTKAIEIIKGTDGGFFSVKFIKKDGTIRKMIGRKGVRKNLKGVGSRVVSPKNPYITIYDVVKRDYRVLNLETLISIKTRGMEFLVENYEKYVNIPDSKSVIAY